MKDDELQNLQKKVEDEEKKVIIAMNHQKLANLKKQKTKILKQKLFSMKHQRLVGFANGFNHAVDSTTGKLWRGIKKLLKAGMNAQKNNPGNTGKKNKIQPFKEPSLFGG